MVKDLIKNLLKKFTDPQCLRTNKGKRPDKKCLTRDIKEGKRTTVIQILTLFKEVVKSHTEELQNYCIE